MESAFLNTTVESLRPMFTGRNEFFEITPIFLREIDNILLPSHFCIYVLRGNNLASLRLGRY